MNAAGSPQTGNGSGNGSSHRQFFNTVKRSALYDKQRVELCARYPRLERDQVFEQFEALFVVLDMDEDAVSWLGGFTYQVRTPDDFPIPLAFYYTYTDDMVVKIQAVVALV